MTVDQLKKQLLEKRSFFKESYRTISDRFGVPLDMVYQAFNDYEVQSAKSEYNRKSFRQAPINQTPIDENALLRFELERLRKQLNIIRQDPENLRSTEKTLPKPFKGGSKANVLIIGDTHVPFERKSYLEFCREQQEKFDCGTVVHIGDVVDQHFSSFHETDPDGLSAGDELNLSVQKLKDWNKVFPEAKVAFGNHDLLIQRQAYSAGLSKKWIKGFNEVLELPGWDFDMEHKIEGVIYTHGTGSSGENGAFQKALNRRCSVVSGHIHTVANIKWNVSEADRIFAMQVGCVDRDTEFLSPMGWKKIGEYDNELVGQYNEDGTVTFVKPHAYIKIPANKLNSIKTKYGVAQIFCDDHDVVYVSKRNTKLLKMRGDEFVSRHNTNSQGFEGRFIPFFKINNDTKYHLTDDEIRLQVAVHADGHFAARRKEGTCIISIKKQRKIERLKILLNNLGLQYEVKTYKDGMSRFIFKAPIKSKNFTKDWYSCSYAQLSVIADEVLYWDGNQKNQYYSKHKEDVDFIQYAFSSTGKKASIYLDSRPRSMTYSVIITERKYCGISGKVPAKFESFETLDGFKYCFNVPSHMLVLRNRDCIFVTGNCGIDDKAYAFEYARGISRKSIISCGVVLEGRLPIVIPMNL